MIGRLIWIPISLEFLLVVANDFCMSPRWVHMIASTFSSHFATWHGIDQILDDCQQYFYYESFCFGL